MATRQTRRGELLEPVFYSLEGFVGFVVTAEGCKANVAFAGGTEANTGGADNMGSVEHLLEELP